MFFAGSDRPRATDRYALVREAAQFADRHGFSAVWTPERHFHEFGGLFPNPSVLAAALAVMTERVQIRAGSLIAALHDPVRIAEEWSVVDNLSRGRVAISFGAGWNADDFIFHPERYAVRQAWLYDAIAEIQRLWRGESVVRENGAGRSISVSVRPRPVQPELPTWVTSSGHVDTFVSAGRIGANLLTHLIGQTLDQLRDKIRRYRDARAANGFDPRAGKVTVMMHTFIGPDLQEVKRIVKLPFCDYLKTAVRLEERAAAAGGAVSGGHRIEQHAIPDAAMQDLLEVTFERYFSTASLLGTVDTCQAMVSRLEACDADEVACLIDFGPSDEQVMASLHSVDRLREACGADARARAEADAINEFSESIL
jgi:natural product biosynthesis luciferase-like monooxygenase protein